MITLTYGGDTLTLHPDLLWNDEHSWSPVQQTAAYSLSGALILDVGVKAAGRPITLQPEDVSSAWMTLDVVETLKAWAAAPAAEMVLNIRGVARDVVFRHSDGALEVSPVIHYSDHEQTDYFLVTIRLMEI